jgi:predicted DNA-binding transcriptional regulator YafY
MRTFRIDRMRDARVGDGRATTPPDDFDVVAHVSTSLARVPWRWEVEVLLELPFEKAAHRLPATLAELTDQGEQTLVRMRVSSLDWTARVLAGLNCEFAIQRPDELRESVRELADRLGACA